MKILAERMRKLRREMELSQQDVADALGLSLGGYCNYEHGTRIPDAKIVAALADLYHVSADYLLGRTDLR